jgi:hypothetical protein
MEGETMNKPIQCTELPDHDPANFVVVATQEESSKYLDKGYTDVIVVTHMRLSWAIEVAEIVLLDTDCDLIMDDINKFSLATSNHMERGAMMKSFLSKTPKLTNKLIMRTDERLDSLDRMIEKIFQ